MALFLQVSVLPGRRHDVFRVMLTRPKRELMYRLPPIPTAPPQKRLAFYLPGWRDCFAPASEGPISARCRSGGRKLGPGISSCDGGVHNLSLSYTVKFQYTKKST